MTINADTLLDRLRLKGQVAKWRILAIVFAVLAVVVLFERYLPGSSLEEAYIARISVNGIVTDNQKTYDLIDSVRKNARIKAVVLSLDTPGGSAVGGEEIFHRLRDLAKIKPVVAVMRSVSASAGYLIALGADYIFAREGTITGSIGVIIETAEITELANKLGITPVIIKSSPLKGTLSPFEKATPEAEQVVRNMIDDFYGHFVDIVAQRRQLSRKQVISLADGRVYSGKAAVENKLIDALGGEKEAMKWLVEQKHIDKALSIKDVKPKEDANIVSHIIQGVTGKFFQSSSLSLDGLLAIWHPQLH